MCGHFGAIIREKNALEASTKDTLAELKAAKDDLNKTVSQCTEAISRAERFQALNSKLEASLA